MKILRILSFLFAVVLLAVMAFSSVQLWGIHQDTVQEAELHGHLLQYRPEAPMAHQADSAVNASADSTFDSPSDSSDFGLDSAPAPRVNQSILDLQSTYADAVGWLSIPNTRIDYPFVQGPDNKHYLHLDLNQQRAAAGTIFLDYRNSPDFSDFNTILFGHHMKNGSMFGTLQHFNDRAFFKENRTGTLFLANRTYEIEFIAFAVIPPNDGIIYNPTITEDADKLAFLDHVSSVARHYRDANVTESDHIITLSTCSYEFNDARMVLIGKLTEI